MSDTLKDFNDLTREEKTDVLNCIKAVCEARWDNWSDESLIGIVQANGITWENLWTSYKKHDDDDFHGVEFHLEDYRDNYVTYCRGKIIAAQTFLPYEMVEDFDLDDEMERDVISL